MEWVSIDLSLHVRVMLTVIKVSIILFPLVGIRNTLEFSKQTSKLFQLSVQVYSLHGQTERERKAFLEGARKRAALAPNSTWLS